MRGPLHSPAAWLFFSRESAPGFSMAASKPHTCMLFSFKLHMSQPGSTCLASSMQLANPSDRVTSCATTPFSPCTSFFHQLLASFVSPTCPNGQWFSPFFTHDHIMQMGYISTLIVPAMKDRLPCRTSYSIGFLTLLTCLSPRLTCRSPVPSTKGVLRPTDKQQVQKASSPARP